MLLRYRLPSSLKNKGEITPFQELAIGMQTDEPKPTSPRFVHIFDTVMEIAVSTLPLVLVVLGIGMMSFSPRRSTTPSFAPTTKHSNFTSKTESNFHPIPRLYW